MTVTSRSVQNTYLTLTLTSTFAASLIWGINTLLLLDAGLTNLQAFLVNAFFTVGQVIFEVPTGVVADAWGRRASYLLGTLVVGFSTVLYVYGWYVQAPLMLWILSSLLLGLGFTFFSGATEAWVVDALNFTKYKGSLESIFSKNQVVAGIAMLSGSVLGGFIAQFSNLGIPYIVRFGLLGIAFVVAFFFMKDVGFAPDKTTSPIKSMKHILRTSVDYGFRNRPLRWVMIAAPFTAGVGIYAFYAMQPYLLELYGNSEAYWIAGIAAAMVGGAQILGGLVTPKISSLFQKRTTILILGVFANIILLALIGLATSFYLATALLIVWALVFATSMPVRQAYLNKLIPSDHRATVLSFDALMGSSGGVVIQPVLGKVADVYSYSISFIGSAIIQIAAIPFLLLAKKEKSKADDAR